MTITKHAVSMVFYFSFFLSFIFLSINTFVYFNYFLELVFAPIPTKKGRQEGNKFKGIIFLFKFFFYKIKYYFFHLLECKIIN
jgi:hypothetical protein